MNISPITNYGINFGKSKVKTDKNDVKHTEKKNAEKINEKAIKIAGVATLAVLVGAGIIKQIKTGKVNTKEIKVTGDTIQAIIAPKNEKLTEEIKEEALRRIATDKKANDIQEGLREALESRLSHKSAEESAKVFVKEAEIKEEALRRIATDKKANDIQEGLKEVLESRLSHKSAEESANVFIKEAEIQEEALRRIAADKKAADIQEGIKEVLESRLSHKSAKESANVFIKEAEIQEEALRRIAADKKAADIQEGLREVFDSKLSYKSAEESAKTIEEALNNGTLKTKKPSLIERIKGFFQTKKITTEEALTEEKDEVVKTVTKTVENTEMKAIKSKPARRTVFVINSEATAKEEATQGAKVLVPKSMQEKIREQEAKIRRAEAQKRAAEEHKRLIEEAKKARRDRIAEEILSDPEIIARLHEEEKAKAILVRKYPWMKNGGSAGKFKALNAKSQQQIKAAQARALHMNSKGKGPGRNFR